MTSLPWWAYWIPVLAALVAGAAALGGVALGPLIQGKAAVSHWRRDRKLDAYAGLVKASSDLSGAFGDYLNAAPWRKDEKRGEFDRRLYELDGASARVALIAPSAAASAAVKLVECAAAEVVPLTGVGAEFDIEKRDAVIAALRQRHQEFLAAARADLGS